MSILYRKESQGAVEVFKIYQDTYELDRSKSQVDFIAGFNSAMALQGHSEYTNESKGASKNYKVYDALGDTIDITCIEKPESLPLFIKWNKRIYKYKHHVASDTNKQVRYRYQLTTDLPNEKDIVVEVPYLGSV